MAYKTDKYVIDNGYITDTSIAQELMNGELSLEDDIVKASVTQVAAYQDIYVNPTVDDPNTIIDESNPNTSKDAKAAAVNDTNIENMNSDDGDSTNNIAFTVDGVEKEWDGSPNTKASKVLAKLEINTPLYIEEDGVLKVFDLTNKKASDLARKDFVTTVHTVTWNAGEHGTCEPTTSTVLHGAALGTLSTVTPAEESSFEGWYDAAEGGNAVTAEKIIDADVTFYAHYTTL